MCTVRPRGRWDGDKLVRKVDEHVYQVPVPDAVDAVHVLLALPGWKGWGRVDVCECRGACESLAAGSWRKEEEKAWAWRRNTA